MKATSNPDAALHRALNAALRQFQAREIVLRYLAPPSSVRWIATALIVHHRVAEKLQADIREEGEISFSYPDLDRYNDQPIARGEGATAVEAIKAMTPVVAGATMSGPRPGRNEPVASAPGRPDLTRSSTNRRHDSAA